jgi:hypothetical protein
MTTRSNARLAARDFRGFLDAAPDQLSGRAGAAEGEGEKGDTEADGEEAAIG